MSAAPLSSEELELWRALEDLDGPDSILDFVPLLSPRYERPNHLRPVAELFWEAETKGNVRGLISTPPRHGKTETILHSIARFLSRNPHKTVGYATYGADLAESKSKSCRDLAVRAGVRLKTDSHAASEWRTTEGGGMLAAGVNGGWTGHGIDILVIDDPIKDRKRAESAAEQAALMDWCTSSAFTRVEPNGSVIVNMTRWTSEDLIGILPTATGLDWVTINLPAITEVLDIKTGRPIIVDGRPVRRALWPERWTLEALDIKKRFVGEYDWASLFMGQPRPRGAQMFREPSRYRAFDLRAGMRFAIGCDPAASAETSADHSAIVVLGAVGSGMDQKVYVLDVWRGQVEVPALVEKLRQMQKRWNAAVFVEAQGGFKAVPQMLRSIGAKSEDKNIDQLRVVEVYASVEKFQRALPVSAAWNDGRVLVPSTPEPWLEDFIKEVTKFTGKLDAADDQVDALAHAFNAIDQRARGINPGPHGLWTPSMV